MEPHIWGAGIPILLLGVMLIGAIVDVSTTANGRRTSAGRRLTSTPIGH